MNESELTARRRESAAGEGAQARTAASVVAATAAGLLAVFAINLLRGCLPLKLLDPQWQLKAIQLVIIHVSFPLVALMLVCLAPQIDPTAAVLRRWRRRSEALAVAAVLLLLALIPLQGLATWRLLRQAQASQTLQWQRDERQFTALRQAIAGASSTADLQRRLLTLEGPVLGRTDRSRPLAEVRRRMLEALELARTNHRQQLASLPSEPVGELVANTLQVWATCLAMACCFAAGARRGGARLTLLEQGLNLGRRLFGRRFPEERHLEAGSRGWP